MTVIIRDNASFKLIILLLLFTIMLEGCVKARPAHIDNICEIFRQYPQWYWDTAKVQQRWGIPIEVQMAIIYKESSFTANAKPPRRKLLWIIPWKRPTTAYGYSQALKNTWADYKRGSGRYFVSRDKFADAADFIGWYAEQAHRKLGIPKYDGFLLYLAYHEGLGGYSAKSYQRKPWLINVAHQVKYQSKIYHIQLIKCRRHIKHKHWYGLSTSH